VSNQPKETIQSTAPSNARELHITRVFDAPRDLVFKAWTDPEHLANWWGPRGSVTPKCEMDARPGGSYQFLMRAASGREVIWSGVCRELKAPEKLVLTCSIRNPDGTVISAETVLTLTLEDQQGKTRLTLHQGVFDSVENCEAHQRGWRDALDRIGEYLARV